MAVRLGVVLLWAAVLTGAGAAGSQEAGQAPLLARILFDEAESALPPAAQPQLTGILPVLRDPARRVRLEAFAALPIDWQARRLALRRALAVRGYLVGRGARAAQIDIHVMGHVMGVAGPGASEPPDRVDIVPADP